MAHLIASITALALLWGGATRAAEAGKAWQPEPFVSDPAAVRAAADAHPPVTDAAVTRLYSEHVFELTPDGRIRERTRRVVRIDDASVIRRLSTFAVSWTPTTTARPTLRARVIDPAGEAHAFDPNRLAEDAGGLTGPDHFSDTRVLAGPLPRLEVGSIVETEALFEEHAPIFTSGHYQTLPLASPTGATHHRIEWRAPVGAAVTVAFVDSAVEPIVTTEGGTQVWRADVFRDPEARPEQSSDFEPWDGLERPRWVVGTTPSWAAAAAEYDAVVEAALDDEGGAASTDVIAEWAAELPRGDARAAARALAARLHGRVRYTGVYFGRGTVIPRPPAEVVAEGFGDCKDLAVFFVGVMRAAGHDARVALVRAVGPGIEASVPGLGAFDHAIARVEADPPLWVDLTASDLPVGELPTNLFGRHALVIGSDTRGLVRLPRPEAEHNTLRVEHHWRIGSESSTVRVTVTAQGPAAYTYRAAPDGWDRTMGRLLGAAFRRQFEAEAAPEVEPPADLLSERIELTAELVSPLGWREQGRSGVWYSPDLFATLPFALREPASADARPARMHAPGRFEFVMRIEAPAGHVLLEGPSEGTHRLGPATLTIERLAGADERSRESAWRWRLDTGPRVWSAEQVAAFRVAVEPFWPLDGRLQIAFEHQGRRALDAGRIAEGLRLYRALTDDSDPTAQLEYMLELSMHGYPHFARALAERFVERHPDDARGWFSLGVARLTGHRGELSPGMDRSGAVAAFERAHALAPDAHHHAFGLVSALAGMPKGLLPDPEPREKALAIARAIPSLAPKAAYLALSLGRPEEALTLLGNVRTAETAAVRLAATALTRGPDAGLASLRALGLDPDTHALAVYEAFMMLNNLRAYDTLQGLRARHADPNQTEAVRLVRDALKAADPGPAETAGAAFSGLLYHLIRPTDDAPLADFATAELIESLAGSALPGQMSAARDMTLHLGLWPASMADGTVVWPMKAQPAPIVGATLVVLEVNTLAMKALVEQTDDGPRVAAIAGDTPVIFGRRMADALARGDRPAALAWRLWAITNAKPDREPLASVRQPIKLAARMTTVSDLPLEWVAAALLSAGSASDRARARALAAEAAVAPDAAPEAQRCLDALNLTLTEGRDAYRAEFKALVDRSPGDDYLPRAWLSILMKSDEPEAAERFIAGLPAQWADSLDGRLARFRLANHRGRFEEADRLGRSLLEGPLRSWVVNSLAWDALFRPGADLREAIGWLEAERASGLRREALHTLATLYGTLGDAETARAILGEMLETSPPFHAVDWLILGLIAEAEGLPEAARDAWQRVPMHPDDSPNASSQLARRGLERLDAVAGR